VPVRTVLTELASNVRSEKISHLFDVRFGREAGRGPATQRQIDVHH
jgi:hypothetical protein